MTRGYFFNCFCSRCNGTSSLQARPAAVSARIAQLGNCLVVASPAFNPKGLNKSSQLSLSTLPCGVLRRPRLLPQLHASSCRRPTSTACSPIDWPCCRPAGHYGGSRHRVGAVAPMAPCSPRPPARPSSPWPPAKVDRNKRLIQCHGRHVAATALTCSSAPPRPNARRAIGPACKTIANIPAPSERIFARTIFTCACTYGTNLLKISHQNRRTLARLVSNNCPGSFGTNSTQIGRCGPKLDNMRQIRQNLANVDQYRSMCAKCRLSSGKI